MMKRKMYVLFGTVAVVLLTMGFRAYDQQNAPWPVPDKYKTMKNPVKLDKTAAATLYSTHCKSCHGKEGLGDGTKAATLATPCGDFTTESFQKQSDGSLFYKISEGREDMPSFKKKIPDQDDLWQLVAYLRTLAK
jgi:mono/diheme cytochrome c family protein